MRRSPRTIMAMLAATGVLASLALLILAPGNSATEPAPNRENDFYDWRARHEAVLELGRASEVDLVFIGDSITHLFGGEPESGRAVAQDVWDRYYGNRRALNLGFGWDRTQNVLWRLEHGELDRMRPRVAVVLIGTNNLVETATARRNTPTEIAEAVMRICDEIDGRVPGCRILVVGLLPRAPESFVEPIRQTNSLLAEGCRIQGLQFLDLGAAFADSTGLPLPGLMNDSVHPSRDGYEVWAEAMEPILSSLLDGQDGQ